MKISNQLVIMPVDDLETLIMSAVMNCLKDFRPTPSLKEDTDTYLTRKEAAKIAGACLATIDNWAREGYIKKYRQGNIVRFKLSDLKDFLEGK